MRKELIIGGVGVGVVLALVVYFGRGYLMQTGNSDSTKTVQATPPVVVRQAEEMTGREVALTLDEVKKHNQTEDCWVVVNDNVYDVTGYGAKHPGGEERIYPFCGGDITKMFETKGGKGKHTEKADMLHEQMLLGAVDEVVEIKQRLVKTNAD